MRPRDGKRPRSPPEAPSDALAYIADGARYNVRIRMLAHPVPGSAGTADGASGPAYARTLLGNYIK